jgi:hypothetical protein
MTDEITGYDAVEGYCAALSYAPGERLTIHASCSTPTFTARIERWGARREEVWASGVLDGVAHGLPADADSNGCNWPAAIELDVPEGWRSGFYVVTLTAAGAPADRATSHACFVVRANARRAGNLLVIATNTYNAYNSWGGRSLYTGGKEVSFRRPFGRGMIDRAATERDDRKARPRHRGEEPDVDGEIYQAYRFANGLPGFMGSAGWFTYERRFVEWAEAAGVDLDYAISADLEVDGVTDGYDVVVGVGHDEYWSAPARDAVEAHVRAGGTYASMSGNTMFWQVRLEDRPSSGGAGGDTMVCHKYSAHHTDDRATATTGMWCDPMVERPESAFLGASSAYGLYSRFGMATPRGSGAFTVYREDHWLLAGTGLRYGDLLGADHGVVGYETVGCRIAFDDVQLPVRAGGDHTPEDVEIVAFTPSSNLAMGEYPKSIAALEDQGDLEFIATRLYGGTDPASLAKVRHGNAVMLVARPFGADGGEVVTIGSTDWVFGYDAPADPCVVQVTRNILDRPARRRAGRDA